MEEISIAGHGEPIPVSAVAARMLRERMEEAAQKRGPEEAAAFEELIGVRLGSLIDSGMSSVDVATMRSVVLYVETPVEEEEATSGLGRAVQGFRDRLAQRGGPAR